MRLVAEAWEDLKRNRGAVLLYLGVHFLLVFILQSAELAATKAVLFQRILEEAMSLGRAAAHLPSWYAPYHLSRQLVVAGAIGLLQAVVFARLGKEIDRPLWKCGSDREALRRFFVVWFLLNLLQVTLRQLIISARRADFQDAEALFSLVFSLTWVLYLPIGVCIMYWGRLDWRHLGEALAPIVEQFRLTLLVFLLMLFQLVFDTVSAEVMRGGHGVMGPCVLVVVLTWIECLAFAAMWRICMVHRDTTLTGEGRI